MVFLERVMLTPHWTSGVPRVLILDNAPELTQGLFKKKALQVQCPIKPIEAYTPNVNEAEMLNREPKRMLKRVMVETGSLEVLWDHWVVWCALVRSHTALNIRALEGEVPNTVITGDTADISFLAEFGWYQWVWFITPKGPDSVETKRLGRYCGPAFDVGDALCARILTDKGRFVYRTSVIPLDKGEENSDALKERKAAFTESLKKALGSRYSIAKHDDTSWEETPEAVNYVPIDDRDPDPEPPLQEADEMTDEAFDQYISARVCIPQGEHKSYGTIVARKRDADNNLIGHSHSNPFLNTAMYEVKFDTGESEAYSANMIAEAIYA